jgi:hypothetical protein
MEKHVSIKSVLSLSVLAVLPVIASGQSPRATAHTAWGDPDLQGVWDFRTITPLQRPEELASKEVLTSEEAAELEEEAVLNDVDRPPPDGSVGGYNRFWFDYGTNVVEDRRTSLIVDPADGKLPPLVPQALEQIGSFGNEVPEQRPIRYRSGGAGTDGPEDRGLSERCIVGFNAGPPIAPGAYNNNVQLLQTENYVVIFTEMIHDARIVPLDERPALPDGIRLWMGNSRGHWDNDTLVVETTNFTDKIGYYISSPSPRRPVALGSGETFHLTERFSRPDIDTLLYEYTVTDPDTFTQPFTVLIPMRRSESQIYEYACHEGNYSVPLMLSGARALERVEQDR